VCRTYSNLPEPTHKGAAAKIGSMLSGEV
jgi:hypothetical protein